MTSFGYIIVDSCIISLHLNCVLQLKQFYYMATKVSCRKKCYYFWWSTWLFRQTSVKNKENSYICIKNCFLYLVLMHLILPNSIDVVLNLSNLLMSSTKYCHTLQTRCVKPMYYLMTDVFVMVQTAMLLCQARHKTTSAVDGILIFKRYYM